MPALIALIALHRHLGYAKWDYTPTGRGFDSHVGYFQGQCGYYNKSFDVTVPGLDSAFLRLTPTGEIFV